MELEVQGLTDAVDTDFLILYLESRRHSGGGPVSSYSRTGSQALVTFENPSDAENVLSKEEHIVQSVNIHVRRLPPWDPGKVALCGLHPEAEECLLELYVENVSGREDFLLVRSLDQRTVLVAFHRPLSDDEFNRLERSVQKRSVHGSWPSVQRVRLCAEVLVENVGSSISKELLEIYFESHRSGGGRVNWLTMLRNNSTAVVSFSDVSVAARVLSRSHSLQDCQLAVSPYYPTLMGSPSTEETGPQEGNHSEGPQGEEGRGNELQGQLQNGQQTDMRTEDEIEVQDWHGEARSEPVIMDLSKDQAQDLAVKDQNRGQQKAEIPEGVMAAAPPMVAIRDKETRVSSDTGTSLRSMQEAEVLMDSSELRFMQEYQHELLAGMDQVTIVPLEAQDRCGFKVAGDVVSCKTAVELLSHMVSSLSSRMVTLQYPGVSLFLLEDEGQQAVLEIEQQQRCIIDMSHLSWNVAGSKHVDPWSFVHISDTSPVQSIMAEELSEAAGARLAADIEDIKVFASLLESSQDEDDKGETVEWNLKQEDNEVDLYTDNSAKSQDEGSSKSEDEELDQACKMSRDEFQSERLDEEAQLLLAIQMSMDTQGTTMEDEDKQLQQALELSLREQVLEEVEESLQRALEMSLQNPWPYKTTHAQEHIEVSGNEIEKALNTAQIKVLAEDETSLVVACATIRKAVTGRLCTVTLDGIDNFQNKAEILSALEKKHMVTITVHEGQAQIHGFLQNPLKCQEQLSLILDALPAGSRPQAGPMTLDPLQTVVLIPVSDSSEEYNRVVQQFLDTLHELGSVTQVLQVQKVQNTLLYNQYQLKKQSMLAQRPGTLIERTLYHGTTENGAKEICHHGFNRSFCGKNATFYGHGVYFAIESTMSARDKYSPPSSAGNKYILVAQVLTGEFALGKEDMKTPPIKPGTVGEVPQRYDSLVDHLQSPAIFVIFNDTQAYPQYLITCRNNKDSGK
ncbi:protein mono-ADP-ribosyltransferase PARP10 [Bufo bufo]|uniref:protein mono-ADP-ribosyltransferase PARP10 n=1 Tax=Bufo bufo TaxID=8384 RepID=UPI001ABE178D|nr:protein mono-ADP-ribosyltransferase PARP10 [Bufo bufo]XP_040288066.1 protein mono-ADP-ribosyltransferase PARP10 [Bufo bufo]XP_040288067.1 protein mono-ADP-ribosyltransferase PARP10 [Bufo bufo]